MTSGWVLGTAFVLGLVGGALCWRLLAPAFDQELFLRTNHRGASVPVAAGVVLPIVLVAAASLLVLGESFDIVSAPLDALAITVAAATGFALLGLLDDLAGDASSRGFAGHLRALRQGRLTTGAVKLFGGAAVAVIAASATSPESPTRLLVDAALVALSANLANLLDRAPGRVGKASLVAAVPIAAIAGADARLAGALVVCGCLVALLRHDLRERLMLGDTGANVLGGTLGLSVVLVAEPTTRAITLAVVAAFNVASELVSFSAVIDRVPPLRWFDRLGRPVETPG